MVTMALMEDMPLMEWSEMRTFLKTPKLVVMLFTSLKEFIMLIMPKLKLSQTSHILLLVETLPQMVDIKLKVW